MHSRIRCCKSSDASCMCKSKQAEHGISKRDMRSVVLRDVNAVCMHAMRMLCSPHAGLCSPPVGVLPSLYACGGSALLYAVAVPFYMYMQANSTQQKCPIHSHSCPTCSTLPYLHWFRFPHICGLCLSHAGTPFSLCASSACYACLRPPQFLHFEGANRIKT